MGEFAKKWLAGVGAAAVVTAIAVIAIGKMERKNIPAPSNQITASKPAIQSPTAPVQPQTSTAAATQPSETKIPSQTEEVKPAVSQNAAQKVTKTQPRVVSKAGMSAGPQHGAQANNVPATPPSNATTQPPAAQANAPVAPPDVATPPVRTVQPEAQPATMQVGPPEGMTITGNVTVGGEFTKISKIVYPNDQVVTPGQNGALATAKGNAIALGANTEFKPDTINSFQLDSGASNVSTKTGMKARVKGNWRIEPVHPDAATQYEVNYENEGIYVYARVNDVDVINSNCQGPIRVNEGRAIRIPNFKRCGVYWLDEGGRTWPYKAAWGGAAAGGTGVIIWIATHQDMSPDHR